MLSFHVDFESSSLPEMDSDVWAVYYPDDDIPYLEHLGKPSSIQCVIHCAKDAAFIEYRFLRHQSSKGDFRFFYYDVSKNEWANRNVYLTHSKMDAVSFVRNALEHYHRLRSFIEDNNL